MGFCSNCGKELREGAAFCPVCGTSTGAGAPAPGQPKKKNMAWLFIVIGAAVTVAAVLAVLIFAVLPAGRLNSAIELADELMDQGSYEEAILAYHDAIDIDPKDPRPYIGCANAYKAVYLFDDARDILMLGLASVPEKDRDVIEQALDRLDESIPPAGDDEDYAEPERSLNPLPEDEFDEAVGEDPASIRLVGLDNYFYSILSYAVPIDIDIIQDYYPENDNGPEEYPGSLTFEALYNTGNGEELRMSYAGSYSWDEGYQGGYGLFTVNGETMELFVESQNISLYSVDIDNTDDYKELMLSDSFTTHFIRYGEDGISYLGNFWDPWSDYLALARTDGSELVGAGILTDGRGTLVRTLDTIAFTSPRTAVNCYRVEGGALTRQRTDADFTSKPLETEVCSAYFVEMPMVEDVYSEIWNYLDGRDITECSISIPNDSNITIHDISPEYMRGETIVIDWVYVEISGMKGYIMSVIFLEG